MVKLWRQIDRHRLFPIAGNNVLGLVCEALIDGIMARYDFCVVQFIAREMINRVVCTYVVLTFLCLLTLVGFGNWCAGTVECGKNHWAEEHY